MQSVSLGSLKLEAHHDKVTNRVAGLTKVQFLCQEIGFFKELRDEAEAVHGMARPVNYSQANLEVASKKVQAIRRELQVQVVGTRRQMALLDLQTRNNFQVVIEQHYDRHAFKLGDKLQTLEDRVQVRQDQKKANQSGRKESFVGLKDVDYKANANMFLKRINGVKKEIRRRLILGGRVKKHQRRQEGHIFIQGKREKRSLSWFTFMEKHKRYYPCKSVDRKNIDGQQLTKQQIRSQYEKICMESPMKRSQKQEQRGVDVNPALLASIQDNFFKEETQNIKTKNISLQKKIQIIKEALEKRENKNTLSFLERQKAITSEQARVREYLAYLKMGETFAKNLQVCSLKWIEDDSIASKAKVGRAREWADQRQLEQKGGSSHLMKKKKQRCKSEEKGGEDKGLMLQSLLPETFKSNAKTNTSLERC